MSAKARSAVFDALNSGQIFLVDALIAEYEKEQTENAIDSMSPETARHKVIAARDIRALLKRPQERTE